MKKLLLLTFFALPLAASLPPNTSLNNLLAMKKIQDNGMNYEQHMRSQYDKYSLTMLRHLGIPHEKMMLYFATTHSLKSYNEKAKNNGPQHIQFDPTVPQEIRNIVIASAARQKFYLPFSVTMDPVNIYHASGNTCPQYVTYINNFQDLSNLSAAFDKAIATNDPIMNINIGTQIRSPHFIIPHELTHLGEFDFFLRAIVGGHLNLSVEDMNTNEKWLMYSRLLEKRADHFPILYNKKLAPDALNFFKNIHEVAPDMPGKTDHPTHKERYDYVKKIYKSLEIEETFQASQHPPSKKRDYSSVD